jgi:hypothetical protein
MTIYKESKSGKPKGTLHIFSDKTFDYSLELLGDFFVKKMDHREIDFESFLRNPEWAWSIYGRSGKRLEKALCTQ